MSYATKRGGPGERVLEGRHVIGLFMAVILLSGLFFTLGYVMGRNQSEGQVRAADFRESPAPPKPEVTPKRQSKTTPAGTPADTEAPASSEWEFYHAGETKTEDRLRPAAVAPVAAGKSSPEVIKTTASPKTAASGSKRSTAQLPIPRGGLMLQVAAMNRESDALDLARVLQKKKFPAFVLSPQSDKYYRVQVGPYADPKAAEDARKGLEGAGFKAFVKH